MFRFRGGRPTLCAHGDCADALPSSCKVRGCPRAIPGKLSVWPVTGPAERASGSNVGSLWVRCEFALGSLFLYPPREMPRAGRSHPSQAVSTCRHDPKKQGTGSNARPLSPELTPESLRVNQPSLRARRVEPRSTLTTDSRSRSSSDRRSACQRRNCNWVPLPSRGCRVAN